MGKIQIGRNIRCLRQFRGIKQATFAKDMGISRVMLSRYENDKSPVSIEKLGKIAELLEVDIASLLNRKT